MHPHNFKGPFVIEPLTSTNAVIALKGNDNAEHLNISRQRLSKCSSEMDYAIPWVGHSGRLYKRRCMKKQPQGLLPQDETSSGLLGSDPTSLPSGIATTKSG